MSPPLALSPCSLPVSTVKQEVNRTGQTFFLILFSVDCSDCWLIALKQARACLKLNLHPPPASPPAAWSLSLSLPVSYTALFQPFLIPLDWWIFLHPPLGLLHQSTSLSSCLNISSSTPRTPCFTLFYLLAMCFANEQITDCILLTEQPAAWLALIRAHPTINIWKYGDN